MIKVTSIGYHDTGASIIEALLKEFDNCQGGPANYESRFMQDPDGISDLEYNIVENPHRLNSGFAVKRYWLYCKRYRHNYAAIYGNKWLEVSKKYVKSLIKEEFKGYWDADRSLFNPLEYIYYYGRRVIQKILPRKLRFPVNHNYCPYIDFYHVSMTEAEFLQKTNDYMEELCSLLNPKNKDFVYLDQIVSTNNIERYSRYIKGLKVILVDRDPRDVYIADAIHGHVLPKDVRQFCTVFRDSRLKRDLERKNENVLFVMMEDLIYHYEQTVQSVLDFIGEEQDHWVRKGSVFNAEHSKRHTKLWVIHPEESENIRYIEEHLSEYLYDYDTL